MGFEKLLLRNRYSERILVFHGVDRIGQTQFNSRFVSKDYFEEFIAWISTHYHIVSLEDYYQKKFKKGSLNIALTFDDGYRNNFDYVVPILEKYQVPASFYISTIHQKQDFLWADFLDLVSHYTHKKEITFEGNRYQMNAKNEFVYKKTTLKNTCKSLPYQRIEPLFQVFKEEWKSIQSKSLSDYWALMTEAQIKSIQQHQLFSIGAHGFTHANLAKISIQEAKQEILHSKQILESICKHSIEEFAFPFGSYNQELVEYCKSIGFKKILLVDYQSKKEKQDEQAQQRFVINPYLNLKHQLACLLRGAYY